MPARACFFLGAGASRAAGVPLADELKAEVARDVFGDDVPGEIVGGRLEDVMELFQAMGGQDGYELVASRLRRYDRPSDGYMLLAGVSTQGETPCIDPCERWTACPLLLYNGQNGGWNVSKPGEKPFRKLTQATRPG